MVYLQVIVAQYISFFSSRTFQVRNSKIASSCTTSTYNYFQPPFLNNFIKALVACIR
jgi:hypothetical protein